MSSGELLNASKAGNLKEVTRILLTKPNVNGADSAGNTALLRASMKGHVGVVNSLLQAGADMDVGTTANGWTALMWAAQNNHAMVVRALLQAGVDPGQTDKKGRTAWDLAQTGEIKQLLETSPSRPKPALDMSLAAQCSRLVREVSLTPSRQALMQRRDALLVQFHAADSVDEDFKRIAEIGLQLQALEKQSSRLPLSEEAYLNLVDRHAVLMQEVADKCKELAKAKDFDAVIALGASLTALREVKLPVIERGAGTRRVPGYAATGAVRVDRTAEVQRYRTLSAALAKQVADVPARKVLAQRIEALQAQYKAAEDAGIDFVLVGTLGKQILQLEKECAQLSLSSEVYQTLKGRHAALVQEVRGKCRELKESGDFTDLGALAVILSELKALDLSDLPQSSDDGSLELDDDSDLDPVLPPPLMFRK